MSDINEQNVSAEFMESEQTVDRLNEEKHWEYPRVLTAWLESCSMYREHLMTNIRMIPLEERDAALRTLEDLAIGLESCSSYREHLIQNIGTIPLEERVAALRYLEESAMGMDMVLEELFNAVG